MAKFTCNACGGTFTSPSTDGSIYFHSCPPLAWHEVVAESKAGAGFIDPDLEEDCRIADSHQDPTVEAPAAVLAARNRLDGRNLRRPGHVDQNLAILRWKDPEEKAPLPRKAEGAGVTQVAK